MSLSTFDFNELTVSRVSRHYGRRRALDCVSMTLRSGELVGLLGPNGAGKSTLLGLIATLIRPSSGSVAYGGRPASETSAALRSKLGFLSHDLQLYTELTARENLEFFAELYGLEDPRECAARALQLAGLESRGDDLVQGFSRGMCQRLALERVLLHQPRLILLDEPFTGLDPVNSRVVAEVQWGRLAVKILHERYLLRQLDVDFRYWLLGAAFRQYYLAASALGDEYGSGTSGERFDKCFSKETFDIASEIGLSGVPDLPLWSGNFVLEGFLARSQILR